MFVQWFGPLLDALRELGGSATPKEAVDAVARICKVPQSQRDEVLKPAWSALPIRFIGRGNILCGPG